MHDDIDRERLASNVCCKILPAAGSVSVSMLIMKRVCICAYGVAGTQIVVVLQKKKHCIYYYGICSVSSIDV